MKIMNNSENFPAMSTEELLEELRSLNKSLELADELGTGTEGVSAIIESAKRELMTRGISEDDISKNLAR